MTFAGVIYKMIQELGTRVLVIENANEDTLIALGKMP